ncbi:MAG: alpha/beta hydrolase fold family protein [Acidobacteriaceae bacterium]|nr:alpha/beta hydrolase fold family protein [Acidobacteriaceae bacterium]
MSEEIDFRRRKLLSLAALGAAAAGTSLSLLAQTGLPVPPQALWGATGLGPLKTVKAGVLEIGYYDLGPVSGSPLVLVHGFPFDVQAFAEVGPLLAAHGYRVLIPFLRGHGPTRFIDAATPRSGHAAALGADLLAFLDALALSKVVLAGFDWGARAVCTVAALWPERCAALISVNGYGVLDPSRIDIPAAPERELPQWYQFYFLTERGKAGYTKYHHDTNKMLWKMFSPKWHFEDATFERTAPSFQNADYVDVVIHSYRHRYGRVAGDPAYETINQKLIAQPVIYVPTITLDGADDGVVLPTDGSAYAAKFPERHVHRIVPGAGHNLPQEAPVAFADAVLEAAALPR